MKLIISILTIVLFANVGFVFTQTTKQPITRHDCAYASRPIIDIGGGLLMGKAVKLPLPFLSNTAKTFAQRTTVEVAIEIDERGKVVAVKSENDNKILLNASLKAARKARFSPTLIDGAPTKVKAKISYRFIRGEVSVSYFIEPVQYEYKSVSPKDWTILKMFDDRIRLVIYDLRERKNVQDNEFIKDGKLFAQLCMFEKKSEIIERIKQIGFEILEETNGNGLAGKISLENLENLVEIEEIIRIYPDPVNNFP